MADDTTKPKKQQHKQTAKRRFDCLIVDLGFTAGITIKIDDVAGWRQRSQDMPVPRSRIHLDTRRPTSVRRWQWLAKSRARYNFWSAICRAIPQSILCNDTKIAVAKIQGDAARQRTRVSWELHSHYLFKDRFRRPAKGKGEGLEHT